MGFYVSFKLDQLKIFIIIIISAFVLSWLNTKYYVQAAKVVTGSK